MIDGAKLLSVIDELVAEKGISKEIVLNAICDGLKKAYERQLDNGAVVEVTIDHETGEITATQEMQVVKKVEDDEVEIGLKEAKQKYGDHITIDDIVKVPLNSEELNRLAIIQVGQIIKQQLKEAEKELIYSEYSKYEGQLMVAIVSTIADRYILADVERATVYISNNNLLFSDNYNLGDRITFYVEEVTTSRNIGQIVGSRTAPQFLKCLLEREVPEIFEKIVVVQSVARDPGVRSKVAVYSTNDSVDPIGACVGSKGSRITRVSEELNEEKIDICLYNEDPKVFITNALSPVKVISISLDEETHAAEIVVPNEQLSLAIGKKGSAAKLVAQLTNWKIKIMSYDEALKNNIEILWNANLTEESLEQLKKQIDKKNARNFKTNPFIPKEKLETPVPNDIGIIEEHIEEEEKYVENEDDYHVEDLTGEEEHLDDNLENKDIIVEDDDIDYEDYDKYYDED